MSQVGKWPVWDTAACSPKKLLHPWILSPPRQDAGTPRRTWQRVRLFYLGKRVRPRPPSRSGPRPPIPRTSNPFSNFHAPPIPRTSNPFSNFHAPPIPARPTRSPTSTLHPSPHVQLLLQLPRPRSTTLSLIAKPPVFEPGGFAQLARRSSSGHENVKFPADDHFLRRNPQMGIESLNSSSGVSEPLRDSGRTPCPPSAPSSRCPASA